jgi:hypothetical protein
MPDGFEAVIVALSVSVVLLTGAVVFGATADTLGQGSADDAERITNQSQLLDGTNFVDVADCCGGTNERVLDSRGYAVQLSGTSDSYVQSSDDIQVATDENATVAVWGYVNRSAGGEEMTLANVGGRVIIQYNGTASEWVIFYHSGYSGDSYRLTAAAPNQPSSWTHLAPRVNGTHLTVYRDGAAVNATTITDPSVVDAEVNSTNWHGRLEELRTFDAALSESTIAELESDAVGPQPGTNRTSRVMFDEPNRRSQLLFFSAGEIRTSNVTYATGQPGSEMDGVGLIASIIGTTDYEWDTDGPRMRAVDGGELDGAPVAYVSYDKDGPSVAITEGFAAFIELAAIIPILLIAVVLVARLRGLR